MEESIRVLENPIYRKALILAFHLTTHHMQTITPAVIETQLKREDMFLEFQEVVRVLSEYEQPVKTLESSEWDTQVVQNNDVIQFIYNDYHPDTVKTTCMQRIAPQRIELPMELSEEEATPSTEENKDIKEA